ncbi:uncharacterized protein LOC120168182 [Hibiscus syriacus]|uniref:uncharacterized protein LOC120168182 n=1 Tax=Hibiscus syriacus TaxID=106335 RepID=UPI001922259B|nr:uncharacterized protein LOC120168182 [Hibiscus syriacus]
MIICFWNVRGINNVLKRGKIFKRLENLGVNIICFIETRVRSCNVSNVVGAFVDEWNFEANYQYIEGGRLWILWNKRLSLSVIGGCDKALSIRGDISGHSVVITAIYGSNNSESRRGLWDYLRSLESEIDHYSWVLGGDFNVIADAQESSDYDLLGLHSSADMEEFKDCLEDLEVHDHPFTGPLFTWSNKQDETYLARKLDRILTNSQWLLDFPDSCVEFKAPGASDHCLGVRESWLMHCEGNAMQIMFNKLKKLNHVLKELNMNYFSDISARVTTKRAELESVQLSILSGDSHFGVEEENKVHADPVDLEVAELEFYRQKTKIHWLQEGDLSIKIFHHKVALQKMKNTIRVIKSEDG